MTSGAPTEAAEEGLGHGHSFPFPPTSFKKILEYCPVSENQTSEGLVRQADTHSCDLEALTDPLVQTLWQGIQVTLPGETGKQFEFCCF